MTENEEWLKELAETEASYIFESIALKDRYVSNIRRHLRK